VTWWLFASDPAQLVPARSQMALELAEETTGPGAGESVGATAGEPGRQ
jgi:hypothetical protein